jgi:Putative auto-transporter adhesin, head GIN domain
MHKHLLLITVLGLVAAVIFLRAAWMLSGGGGLSDIAMRFTGSRLPICSEAPADGPATREVAWNGADSVAVALPADIRYSPNNADQMMKVTGTPALVSHIVVDKGEIKLDCRPGRLKTGRIAIVLPGRSFRSFSLAGFTSLTLSDIDQPELHFNLAGSSSVAAAGKVESLHINCAGSSDARLGALSAEEAHLNLVGASTVEADVTDSLMLNSVGASTVSLRGEPRNIESHVVGTSRIVHNAL